MDAIRIEKETTMKTTMMAVCRTCGAVMPPASPEHVAHKLLDHIIRIVKRGA
jgi:hypothetical protein